MGERRPAPLVDCDAGSELHLRLDISFSWAMPQFSFAIYS
jgi:hypothetical protein